MNKHPFGWDYPPGVTGNEPQINPPDDEEDLWCEECESEPCICDEEDYPPYCDRCKCAPCQCDAMYDRWVDQQMEDLP